MVMQSPVHGFLERISRDELIASLKFLALILILLLLPNRELDVLFGLNPQLVWLVVVFIAGLSFLGYILARLIHPATAVVITGAIGACASPNLAIMSLTEQERRHPEFAHVCALAAAIASTVLFPRMLVIIAIVHPPLALSLLIPFLAMTGVGATVSVALWSHIRSQGAPSIDLNISFHVRSALVFGVIVAAVLLVINAFDIAIPSTVARMGIVLAALAKLVINVVIAWMAGARGMARATALVLLCSAGIGIALVLLL